MRALVLAADPSELAMIGQALESLGLRVELLTDPAAARRRLAAAMPDLVVLDGEHPHAALFDVYAALRDAPGGEQVPVIFTRYVDAPPDQGGADRYLPPSADASALVAATRQMLELPERAATEPAAAGSPPTETTRRTGRWLEVVLLVVGIILLLLGAVIVVARRDALPPLVVPPTAVPTGVPSGRWGGPPDALAMPLFDPSSGQDGGAVPPSRITPVSSMATGVTPS